MESRSRTKQLEMEEQLSKHLAILTTVHEQQSRQEQLSKEHKADLEKFSRDHKADIEKVASTQHEQAARQEDLARFQETKWSQFMEMQDKSCLELEHKQLDAESTVQSQRRLEGSNY